jgi:ankyrin repeat protein
LIDHLTKEEIFSQKLILTVSTLFFIVRKAHSSHDTTKDEKATKKASLKSQISNIQHTMGQTLSITKANRHPQVSPLLQPAIEGNLSLIKQQIGEHIATYDHDPNQQNPSQLQQYVNAADAEGNTALIGACFAGHLNICQCLIEDCGADVRIQNGIGCSALWIAAGYGHVQILEYLMNVIMDSSTSVETEEERLEILFSVNSSGDTPFIAASSKGHVNICKSLLNGVIAKCRTGDGIFHAYRLLCTENKAGDTALAIAVGNGYEGPLLDFLLDSEDMYWKQLTEEGTISSTSNSDTIRPLHAKSAKGLTPLIVACERCHTNIVKELIRRGAEPTPDSNGRSPLAVASFCGLMEVVEFLLNGDGAKMGRELLNVLDNNGCTPLWLAARTGNGKMVTVLLDAGADPSIKNKDGLSPEEAAVKFKKQNVLDAFENDRRIEILEDN